jgi:hypothetical protein
MLLVLAMIGAGNWVLSRYFFGGYSGLPPTWMFVAVIVTGTISAAITIIFINRKNIAGLKRAACFIPASILTIIVSGIFAESLHRKFMTDNESVANKTCIFLAEAQEIFRRTDWDTDGVLEYAQKISELWETSPGTRNVTLINAEIFAADSTLPNPKPYKGYLFKPLHSRKVNDKTVSYTNSAGNQTLGYAFIAYPAQYKMTGVMTFTISSTGTIYQKDLGLDTTSIALKTDTFDPPPPDPTWVHPE